MAPGEGGTTKEQPRPRVGYFWNPQRQGSHGSTGPSCQLLSFQIALTPPTSNPTPSAQRCLCAPPSLLRSLSHESYLFLFISSVQSLSCVQLFATPWAAARQAFLSITNSQSPPKLMSIESVMPSNHLILSHPLPLPPSTFPSIRVFSNESVLRIRWPENWP